MPSIVEPNQGAVTQGGESLDNALIVLECYHSILSKDTILNKEKSCLAIKLDIKKAYDTLSWEFIQYTLSNFHFPPRISQLILKCISTTSIAIRFNGRTT